MYEHLCGYDSIDALVAEQRDALKEGLNNLPPYIDIIRYMAKGRKSYSIGVFVRLDGKNAEKSGKKHSRYMSLNDPKTGEILSIEECLDENQPEFALVISERKLIKVIENADDIRRKFDTEDYLGILGYINFSDVWLGRLRDYVNFRLFIAVLKQSFKI